MKTTSISFRVSDKMLAWIDEQAQVSDLSRSGVVLWYLERAAGEDPEVSLMRQMLNRTEHQFRKSLLGAVHDIVPALTEMIVRRMNLEHSPLAEALEALDQEDTVDWSEGTPKRKLHGTIADTAKKEFWDNRRELLGKKPLRKRKKRTRKPRSE